jgi:acyl dehydratase
VHGEHDVYFHAPLQPESTVRLEVTPHSTHQTPAGLLLTQRILVSDTEGNPLVEHLWSSLYVGGATESLGGPTLPDHRFPEAARRRGIGSETIDIALDQSFRYAGVTDDRVPHSLDDEAARREGFPFKILQGMCTMSMCAGAVVRVAGEGNPLALRRLAARFAAPVHPKHQLVVEVFDVESTSEVYRAVAFEARSGGVTCIRHGRAEFATQKG